MFSLVGFCSHKKVTFLDLHAFISSVHMQSYILMFAFSIFVLNSRQKIYFQAI